jgi:hypothetical protein
MSAKQTRIGRCSWIAIDEDRRRFLSRQHYAADDFAGAQVVERL